MGTYRKTCSQHKLQFNRNLCMEMNGIRIKQPKELENVLRNKEHTKPCTVSLNDFCTFQIFCTLTV